jgi:hypothetical protein
MRIHDFPPEVVPMVSGLSNAHLVPISPLAITGEVPRAGRTAFLFFRMQKLPAAEKFAPNRVAGRRSFILPGAARRQE